MKKKIFAVCILMLMMCAMAASVFAADNEVLDYDVTVSYRDSRGNVKTVTYTVSASSPSEAQQMAKENCQSYEGATNSDIVSCGAAIPRVQR